MENSNLYINNEGVLCYNESTMKETLYVKSIFQNIFGTIFNVSLEKDN
jgi:hypothetical protein